MQKVPSIERQRAGQLVQLQVVRTCAVEDEGVGADSQTRARVGCQGDGRHSVVLDTVEI